MAQELLRSLIGRNNTASKSWRPMPTIKSMREAGVKTGGPVIVTCADPRANPTNYLDLNPGEVTTMRNAGGRVTEDVLSSLELITAFAPIQMLIVIHHTDCGGINVSDDDIRSTLSEKWPEHAQTIEHKSWHSFLNIGMDQSIRDDVSILKGWKFLSKDTPVGGYVFDIETGQLREVVAPNFNSES